MTARSKKQRVRNKRIKREVNKVRELKRLQVTVLGKNAKELMEVCSEVVDVKSHEELKKKKAEKVIEEEFVREMRVEIESTKKKRKQKGKTIQIVNEHTGKTHNYNTRTLRDEFNSYPPWLNVGNHKRKVKRRKTAMKKGSFQMLTT